MKKDNYDVSNSNVNNEVYKRKMLIPYLRISTVGKTYMFDSCNIFLNNYYLVYGLIIIQTLNIIPSYIKD